MADESKRARAVPSSTRRLLAQARRAGLDNVTERQIQRWKSAGLLPPARREGVKGRGGTTSYYPPGTLKQVRELRTLLDDEHYPRDLDKAAVLLFLRGYTVTEHALRRALANLLDGFLSPVTNADTAEEAACAVRQRPASVRERAGFSDDAQRERALRSAVEPLFGIHDPAALNLWLELLEADALRPLLEPASVIHAELSRAGKLAIELIPDLTLDSFWSLAGLLAGVVSWIEKKQGFAIRHRERFVNDCLAELRRPYWKRATIRIIESLDRGST